MSTQTKGHTIAEMTPEAKQAAVAMHAAARRQVTDLIRAVSIKTGLSPREIVDNKSCREFFVAALEDLCTEVAKMTGQPESMIRAAFDAALVGWLV